MRKMATPGLVLTFFIAVSAPAEMPSVSVSVHPPTVPYHHPITVEFRMEGPQGTAFTGPDIRLDDGGLEARAADEERESLPEGGVRLRKRYTIESMRPGVFQLPAAAVEWHGHGASGVLETMPLMVRFRELDAGELQAVRQFAGITPPTALLSPRRVSPAYLAAGALGAAIIAILLYRLFRHRPPREIPAPVLAAWEVALSRLRELQRRNLPAKGDIEAYYVDLSAILRYYLEDRFHLRAPEQTTQEFLADAMRFGVLTEVQQAFLAAFLHQCDRVKFARLVPDVADLDDHFSAVRQFIEATIPPQAPSDTLETAA